MTLEKSLSQKVREEWKDYTYAVSNYYKASYKAMEKVLPEKDAYGIPVSTDDGAGNSTKEETVYNSIMAADEAVGGEGWNLLHRVQYKFKVQRKSIL